MDESEQTQWIQWTVAAIAAAVIIGGGWWYLAHRSLKDGAGGMSASSSSATSSAATSSASSAAMKKSETLGGEGSMSTDTQTRGMVPGGAAAGDLPGSVSLTIADQPAGDTVTIASANLEAPGWIAVRDAKGWILGAGWFPGPVTGGVVPLVRATEAGQTYDVLVYTDDGDKQFDFKKDALVEGETTSFTAQ